MDALTKDEEHIILEGMACLALLAQPKPDVLQLLETRIALQMLVTKLGGEKGLVVASAQLISKLIPSLKEKNDAYLKQVDEKDARLDDELAKAQAEYEAHVAAGGCEGCNPDFEAEAPEEEAPAEV